MENDVHNYYRFQVESGKICDFRFTNNKVVWSHFEPPKFSFALAIHVCDNAVALGPRGFVANEISTP